MKKLTISVLFGAFCLTIIYSSAMPVFDWYETGQLAMHRKIVYGPDFVSYDSDFVLFAWELGGRLVFIVMGFWGLVYFSGHKTVASRHEPLPLLGGPPLAVFGPKPTGG